MLKHLSFNGVSKCIFRTLSFRLVESHGTSDFRILVRGHHVRIESEYIMVTNAVSDAVPVQATAEYHGSGGILLLVFVQNGCAGESEKQRVGEGTADDLQHVAEGGAMAFVHDEDDTSCSKLIQPGLCDASLPCFTLLIFWIEVTIRVSLTLVLLSLSRNTPVFSVPCTSVSLSAKLRYSFNDWVPSSIRSMRNTTLSASCESAMSCADLKLVMVLPEPVVCHT